jgi:perosamine synthetase
VFVDILRDTWIIDPDDVVEKLTPRTRAVIPVDLFGLCADMPALRAKLAAAGRSDVFLLEDAAESFGSELNGVCAGALGDAAAFSFYGNKTITTGEGGMVTTSRADLADRVRFLKNHAMIPEKRYYHPEVGFNFRMTNLQAAIGLAQLSAADDLISRKMRIHARYRAQLGSQAGIHLQHVPAGHRVATWLTVIVDDSFSGEDERDAMMKRLLARGIDTRPMFYPNHLLPTFAPDPAAARGTLPVTEDLSFRGIGLPSGAGLTDSDVDRVVATYFEERRP